MLTSPPALTVLCDGVGARDKVMLWATLPVLSRWPLTRALMPGVGGEHVPISSIVGRLSARITSLSLSKFRYMATWPSQAQRSGHCVPTY